MSKEQHPSIGSTSFSWYLTIRSTQLKQVIALATKFSMLLEFYETHKDNRRDMLSSATKHLCNYLYKCETFVIDIQT